MVLGYAKDPQTSHQIACLSSLGAEVHLVEPDLARGEAISWRDGDLMFGRIDVSKIDAVLARSMPMDRVPPEAFGDGALEWPELYQATCIHDCAFDAWMGMLASMKSSGLPMYNAPSAMQASRRKPAQLDLLRRAGCPVPRTLITNDPDRARRFISETGACIVKPVIGGALTRDANALTDEELRALVIAPAIFQQRIFGDDLRVMVLDGEVISSVAIGVPSGTIDFRGDASYASGEISYTEAPLPLDIEQACARALKALDLRFAGIDIKRTAAGEHVMLEANSSPIYLDVEEKMHHPITRRLCERVMRSSRGTSAGRATSRWS
jgi:hypothetical protein